ncbi:MAG: phosphoglycerate kinase [Deltaproteobacteria bacterium]|nr:phosphoglycerate kinase [Deltaproteobacteria bacterium]
MKNIKDINVSGQKVLVRADFNVPFDENGAISDDSRICGVLPTIDYLVKQNAKIILCSHCGRPKGERLRKYSLAPMADRLSKLLGREVKLAHDCVGPEVQHLAATLQDGDILLLENLRFHAEEQKNDAAFARQLASLADIYINDAFAVSHRAHASVEGVTHYMDVCAAGFLLQREVDFFNRSITSPARPLAVVMGGAKVSTKLGAIRNMLDRVDIMIIGGAMANTFLKSQGHEIGKSLVEDELLDTARELLELARSKGVKFYLPVDCVAAEEFSPQAVTKLSTIQDMPPRWLSLDIGPASSTLFGEALADAGTIVWNGPMGAFEMAPFARGSLAMVNTVTASHALSIVGGGDTNVVIKQAGAASEISYISTGGGAFLMLMEGKELPGIAALA